MPRYGCEMPHSNRSRLTHAAIFVKQAQTPTRMRIPYCIILIYCVLRVAMWRCATGKYQEMAVHSSGLKGAQDTRSIFVSLYWQVLVPRQPLTN